MATRSVVPNRASARRDVFSRAGIMAGVAVVSSLVPVSVSRADTRGGTDAIIPGFPQWPGARPDTNNAPVWGWIANEHILVSQGWRNYLRRGNNDVLSSGRLSFGTTGGSRMGSGDDFMGLNGLYTLNPFTSVFPYASSSADGSLDFPSNVQILVDRDEVADTGEVYNVGYAPDGWLPDKYPRFAMSRSGPVLTSSHQVTDDLVVHTEIKLLRSTARLQWTIENTSADTPHKVGLRFTVNHRSAASGIYFVNPETGENNTTAQWTTRRPPSVLEVFARRAEADLSDRSKPAFHSRHIFRGYGATEPSAVLVADTRTMYPGEAEAGVLANYLPADVEGKPFDLGIAVASYYGGPGGYSLPARAKVTVVTYYGLGTSSENLDRPDALILGTEAPAALQYRAEGANDPAVLGKKATSITAVAPKFLTPNPFEIFASAYSQRSSEPLWDIAFRGTSLSLKLPNGLKFGTAVGSSVPDSPTKEVSGGSVDRSILGDQEGSASWRVEPTGERFGPVSYQVSLSVEQPALALSVSKVINIPSVPLVELIANRFQMIGFPFTFHPVFSNNGDPDTVINTLTSPEEFNTTVWEWINDDASGGNIGRWARSSRLKTGAAYFYKPQIASSGGKRLVFLRGAQPTPFQAPKDNQLSIPTQLTIQPGWNLVSNPFVYEIPLSSIRVIPLDIVPLTSIAFAQAVSSGYLRGSVFFFDAAAGGYDFFQELNSNLKPWTGYWLYSRVRAELQFIPPSLRNSLVVPYTGADIPDLNSGDEAEPPTRKVFTANNWELGFVARRGDGRQDKALVIGVSSNPSESVLKPPPFQDFVQTGIVEKGAESRFAKVIRRSGTKAGWDLEIAADSDETVTLAWPGIRNLPKTVRVTLLDTATNRRIDLRSSASIQVPVRKSGVSRYRVEASAGSTRRLGIAYLRPEASSRSTGTYSYRIGFTDEATYSARIVSLNGRVVQEIANGRSTEAGGSRILWNGRNAEGASVPAGSYRLEVTATGTQGDIVRDQRLITVVR